MKDYQNVFYPYEEPTTTFKKNFYKEYKEYLNDIDKLIITNPNITKGKIQEAMLKGYSVENFLDSCIDLRLNHHKYCIRIKEDLYKDIKDIDYQYLQGDPGHKNHLVELKELKKLGNNVNTKAKNYANKKKYSILRRSKRHKNSRATRNRSYKSSRTTKLLEEKKKALKKK